MRRSRGAVLFLCLGVGLLGQTPVPAAPGVRVEVIGYKSLAEAVAYQFPEPAGQASVLEGFTLKVGALELSFQSGTATPVLVGGKAQGLYLQGKGSFRYLARDPVLHPVLRFNLKENTKIVPKEEALGGLSVGEPLKEAILWFLGRDLPPLPPPSVPAPLNAFRSTWLFFLEREELYSNKLPEDLLARMPIGALAAYRTAHEPGKAVVTAELVGEKEQIGRAHV